MSDRPSWADPVPRSGDRSPGRRREQDPDPPLTGAPDRAPVQGEPEGPARGPAARSRRRGRRGRRGDAPHLQAVPDPVAPIQPDLAGPGGPGWSQAGQAAHAYRSAAGGLVPPPGRQGPGHLPAGAVASLDVAIQRRAGGLLPGEHRSIGIGVGTELSQLRPYEPGDDLRQLDPSASARTNVAHVRLHVPERAMTTWLVLDQSASMGFGTALRLKSDIGEGVATVFGQLAVRRGGRIAVITCGTARPRVVPPRGGRRALATVIRLAEEGVAPDASPARSSLADALGRLRRLARSPGLIVVASDFRDPPSEWRRPLRGLAQRHSIAAVEIYDPREAALPDAGTIVMVDPETGHQVEVPTSSRKIRDAFAEAEAARRAEVALELRKAGADHVTLSTNSDWLRELARRLH